MLLCLYNIISPGGIGPDELGFSVSYQGQRMFPANFLGDGFVDGGTAVAGVVNGWRVETTTALVGHLLGGALETIFVTTVNTKKS